MHPLPPPHPARGDLDHCRPRTHRCARNPTHPYPLHQPGPCAETLTLTLTLDPNPNPTPNQGAEGRRERACQPCSFNASQRGLEQHHLRRGANQRAHRLPDRAAHQPAGAPAASSTAPAAQPPEVCTEMLSSTPFLTTEGHHPTLPLPLSLSSLAHLFPKHAHTLSYQESDFVSKWRRGEWWWHEEWGCWVRSEAGSRVFCGRYRRRHDQEADLRAQMVSATSPIYLGRC